MSEVPGITVYIPSEVCEIASDCAGQIGLSVLRGCWSRGLWQTLVLDLPGPGVPSPSLIWKVLGRRQKPPAALGARCPAVLSAARTEPLDQVLSTEMHRTGFESYDGKGEAVSIAQAEAVAAW